MSQPVDNTVLIVLAGYLPMIAAATLFGIGLFVLSRNRNVAVNGLFATGMVTLAGSDVAWFVFAQSSSAAFLLLWQRMILVTNIVTLPVWYLFAVTYGSGGIRDRRQRNVALGIGAASLFFLFLVPTDYVIQGVSVRYDGAISFPLGWAGKALMVASLALSMVVLSSLEMTFRHAELETRWKIKFLILGLFGILGFQIYWISRTLLHSSIFPDSFGAQAVIHLTGGALVIFSLVRHRLMDVDVFVSRHVVYRSLTLVVVGAYLVLLGIGREAVRLLGLELGDWTSATFLIIGGLVLAALLLADGFQRRVKAFIDTNFYKNKYDYRKEWLSLTERLARAVTVNEVVPRIVEGLLETIWVRKVGIFLLESDKTHLRLSFGKGFGPEEHMLRTDRAFVRYVSENPGPIDVQSGRPKLLGKARGDLLDELRRRGVHIAAPMVVGDEVLGLLVVGPELSGQRFRRDDYDLCRTVAAQAATVIKNARMAEDLAHGRKIQAFAEMSSFIIHDIKNCANMLSLVSTNAESHMHNPAFQRDAIRAIRQSVERMQNLLKRLSAVRRPTLRREHVDLNGLVRECLQSLAGALPMTVSIEVAVGVVPRLLGDAEQLDGVIRNLTMNAIEAIDGRGEIRIETYQKDDEAILVVTDNGRGMSIEFMRESLFRPFRSTKGGLGIGMYQCKNVIEGHGGRLDVESIEGRGTKCVVRLPIEEQNEVTEDSEGTISAGHTAL